MFDCSPADSARSFFAQLFKTRFTGFASRTQARSFSPRQKCPAQESLGCESVRESACAHSSLRAGFGQMGKKCARLAMAGAAAGLLALAAAQPLSAQSQPMTHNLTIGNATESIDAHGRVVLVANVQGDLQGVLTLALVVRADGTVTAGEWALNVSYIQLGPPSSDGDGDPSETLVQLGVIKGSVSGGVADLGNDGLATDLSGIQLNLTGATMQFAGATSGNGTVAGSSINQQNSSTGSLTLTF